MYLYSRTSTYLFKHAPLSSWVLLHLAPAWRPVRTKQTWLYLSDRGKGFLKIFKYTNYRQTHGLKLTQTRLDECLQTLLCVPFDLIQFRQQQTSCVVLNDFARRDSLNTCYELPNGDGYTRCILLVKFAASILLSAFTGRCASFKRTEHNLGYSLEIRLHHL